MFSNVTVPPMQITANASVLLLAILLLFNPSVGYTQKANDNLAKAFEKKVILSEKEQAAFEGRATIAKQLKTSNKREVASFGAIWLQVPKEFFLEQFTDILKWKGRATVPQIGKFHNPPLLEDLKDLTLEKSDLEAIKNCKPGDCKIKLPPDSVSRFKKEIRWKEKDWVQNANALYREILFKYVSDYLIRGNPALVIYDDKKKPVSVRKEFASILDESDYLREATPNFFAYLKDFPDDSLDAVEDFVYWSKEIYRGRPVLSVTHVNIYRGQENGKAFYMIASKQIYANHYFEASLGLAATIEAKEQKDDPGFHLIYLNRSRLDIFGGVFGGIIRSMIDGRIRDALQAYLISTKNRVESEYQKKIAEKRN